MIDFDDDIYYKNGIKGILTQLAGHLLFIVIGGLLLALPCYFAFLILINLED